MIAEALTDDEARGWMRRAYYAATGSPDASTQNGAVLLLPATAGRAPLACCNAPVAGVASGDRRLADRDYKYAVTEHAEEGLVTAAAVRGVSTRGATMIACWAACPGCARLLIQAGVRRVYVHGERMDATPARWRAQVDRGLAMLSDAGVAVIRVEGPVGAGVTIRFDGAEVEV